MIKKGFFFRFHYFFRSPYCVNPKLRTLLEYGIFRYKRCNEVDHDNTIELLLVRARKKDMLEFDQDIRKPPKKGFRY